MKPLHERAHVDAVSQLLGLIDRFTQDQVEGRATAITDLDMLAILHALTRLQTDKKRCPNCGSVEVFRPY